MAESKNGGPAKIIRPIVLLLVLGTAGYFIWKASTRREDYAGGDILTTGTIEAVHVRLGFKAPGRILEVPVNEGDEVGAWALVARLDPKDFDVQVGASQAGLAAARASLAQATATHNRASREYARQKALVAGGAGTGQQLDAARGATEIAAAQVQAARAEIQQAESKLSQARLERMYTELRTPQAGTVSEKSHYPGESVTMGTSVVTLAELDTVKVLAAVDETQVGAVRAGDGVEVRVYSFNNKVFPGTVSAVQPAGEFATRKDWGAQRRDIRTFTVTARLPNPDRLLKDGMTADVRIKASAAARHVAGGRP